MFCQEQDLPDASIKIGKVENLPKPLPLKQRTSSCTDRRDFTPNTWISLLQLIKFREYFITVNHFSIWRRHNAWSMENGKDLRAYITQRYASAMVFMSLLLSTEFGVLFNSSAVTSQVRANLVEAHWNTVGFWAGLFIIIAALFTILSLISTFTFTAMISAIDEANAHCILRSSIGQYATELPGRLIVVSIYSFLISFMSFFFILLPVGYFSFCLLLGTVGLFVHVVSVFSSFGRIIMHTGAMSKARIFSSDYEEFLVPHSLHSNLLAKAKCNVKNNISIMRQYRQKQKPIDCFLLEEELYDYLSGMPTIDQNLTMYSGIGNTATLNRKRADSKVRFADEEMSLASNRKQDIEEKVDQINENGHPTNGPPFRHYRSLTPLSNVSDGWLQHGDQLSSTRSTISGDTTPNNSSRKFFNPSDRPQVVSTQSQPENAVASSFRSVSNASLEQWLQGSSSEPGGKYESQPTIKTPYNDEMKDENKIGPIPLPPTVPPNPVLFNSTWSSSGSHERTKVEEKFVGNLNGELPIRAKLDSEPFLYRHADGREMSEDERFAFDYGDFGKDSAEGGNHVIYGTNENVCDNGWDLKTESDGSINQTENERTRLLK